mmetsp:Transcript_19325/g.23757  ORF Transcript_19325/g.23757 Transcript_19325/m.23757 type:complete len:88 (-) Transcript_19325:427-690(-)
MYRTSIPAVSQTKSIFRQSHQSDQINSHQSHSQYDNPTIHICHPPSVTLPCNEILVDQKQQNILNERPQASKNFVPERNSSQTNDGR